MSFVLGGVMRRDAFSLLDRLGQEDFNYFEFESPSLDVDVWPIFEALLFDERVVGNGSAVPGRKIPGHGEVIVHLPAEIIAPRDLRGEASPVRPSTRHDTAGLFDGYATASAASPEAQTVRRFLNQLAGSNR